MAHLNQDRSGSSRVQSGALDIRLDRDGSLPLYAQLAEDLRARIRSGELALGSRLPSTRDLAGELGVHRKTVVQAFRVLEREGWVEAGVGQGTFVRALPSGLPTGTDGRTQTGVTSARGAARAPRAEEADAGSTQSGAGFDSFAWEEIGPPSTVRDEELRDFVLREPASVDAVRFTGATADPAHFPAEDLRDVIDEVLRTEGVRALDYGPAAGLPSLREWLAERLSARGIPTDPGQVLIVNGSQQGLDLVARTLIGPGDRVLVEEPSYSNGFRLFQTYGATIDSIATDERGLVPEALAASLAKAPGALLYVMPIFQNPTGTVLGPERIDPILDLAAEHQVPILEDHFDADLVYEGEDPEPIKARDTREQVILLGTFSKILFPGLRLGWLVLPRALVERVVQVKQMADLSSGLLVQHAMDRYCRRGLLDLHLERVRRANGERLEVLRECLDGEMPMGVQWTRPRGGMTLWLTLPPEVDSLTLLQTARRLGVDFSPGPLFFPNGGGGHHLRLSYVREPEARIRLGVSRLAAAIREEMARRREEPGRPFV